VKYRAILLDPANTVQERPIQTFSNSLEVIREWAYGSQTGGLERARGVLPGAVGDDAVVQVFVLAEKQIAQWTKKGKSA
jgi:hypothetical protein